MTGGALSGWLGRFKGRPRPDPEDVARLKAWVHEDLALAEDVIVTVSEIDCDDPACGGLETVMLIMVPGRRTVAAKLPGSVVVQTRPAVARAARHALDGGA